MKNLLNLKGVSTLSKQQQQSINGGGPTNEFDCVNNWCGIWFAALQQCLHPENGCA
ncbi:hypothetical protein [Winogradskyella sp.]|uniref:hypothetical protein n=1 Tax=Winogradskyella sp. TaxID=1883156 RepID=UPI0032239274